MKSPRLSWSAGTWLAGAVLAFASLPLLRTAWAQESEPQAKPAPVDYRQAVTELHKVIDEEMQRGILTGVSIALVDGQQTVMEEGFGWADRDRRVPAAADTIYRVGSISKLFTAVAVMQLVEAGKLDLDSPVTKWLPEFRIVNPFDAASPITLRQLMCHRSGMVRESPVGGYLDDSQPIARTEHREPVVMCAGKSARHKDPVLQYRCNDRRTVRSSGQWDVVRRLPERVRAWPFGNDWLKLACGRAGASEVGVGLHARGGRKRRLLFPSGSVV